MCANICDELTGKWWPWIKIWLRAISTLFQARAKLSWSEPEALVPKDYKMKSDLEFLNGKFCCQGEVFFAMLLPPTVVCICIVHLPSLSLLHHCSQWARELGQANQWAGGGLKGLTLNSNDAFQCGTYVKIYTTYILLFLVHIHEMPAHTHYFLCTYTTHVTTHTHIVHIPVTLSTKDTIRKIEPLSL